MKNDLPQSIALFGAGKMGGAMLEGWLAVGMPGPQITLFDPQPSDDIKAMVARHGLHLNPALPLPMPPEVVVLAIKPQMLDSAAQTLAGVITPRTLVLSILAGKTIADIKARVPACQAIVRAMPNLPAAIRRGVTAAAATPGIAPRQHALADALLRAVGKVEWLTDEALIDAVTAVSGSGPAYIFHMVEALAAAGVSSGLPPDMAARLARATVEGAGELLFQLDAPPERLRQNVTSPGGTTAAGLDILMADNGLIALMRRTVAAAKARAEELAG
ncbi:MAG: pyrroline-5-carboxylate reductase [Hyphomicrobiaceae bacterium]